MSTATLISAIVSALTPACSAWQATVETATTPDDTVRILAVSPTGWRVIIQPTSEESVSEEEGGCVQLLRFDVILQGARTLEIDRGRSDFTTRLDQLRELVRGLTFVAPLDATPEGQLSAAVMGADADGNGLTYHGWQWLTLPDVPTRQASLSCSLHVMLGAPVPTLCELPE
jgi:hypothetical protein